MRVSVIIPAFNSAGWIERCIESVRRQTWRDYEVIVIDDASTDGTWEIIKQYEGEGFRVLRNEVNTGHWGSRNRGLDVAQGEVVLFLDSDDELVDNCLARCVELFSSLPLDVGTLHAWSIDDRGRIGGYMRTEPGYIPLCDLLCRNKLRGKPFQAFRREAIGDLRYRAPGVGFPFTNRIAKRARVFFVPEVLYIYHNLTNPASTAKQKRKTRFWIEKARAMAPEVEAYLRELREDYVACCPRSYADLLYNLGAWSLLGGLRSKAIPAFLRSLFYGAGRRGLRIPFYLLLSTLPIRVVRAYYSR